MGALRVLNTWDFPTYLRRWRLRAVTTRRVLGSHGGWGFCRDDLARSGQVGDRILPWLWGSWSFLPYHLRYEAFFTWHREDAQTIRPVLWQFLANPRSCSSSSSAPTVSWVLRREVRRLAGVPALLWKQRTQRYHERRRACLYRRAWCRQVWASRSPVRSLALAVVSLTLLAPAATMTALLSGSALGDRHVCLRSARDS